MKNALMLFALICLHISVARAGWVINAGDPQGPGVDRYRITLTDGTSFVAEPVLVAADNPATKAGKLITAINDHQAGLASLDPMNNTVVLLTDRVQNVELRANNSKQQKANKDAPVPGAEFRPASAVPVKGTIDFHGGVSGRDAAGQPSNFEAAFGTETLLVAANLTATDLSALTIDTLLIAMYSLLAGTLSEPLIGNLELDLANEAIDFAFPNASTYFVRISTSDMLTESTYGLRIVPEPSTFILITAGFLALLGIRRYWRIA